MEKIEIEGIFFMNFHMKNGLRVELKAC